MQFLMLIRIANREDYENAKPLPDELHVAMGELMEEWTKGLPDCMTCTSSSDRIAGVRRPVTNPRASILSAHDPSRPMSGRCEW